MTKQRTQGTDKFKTVLNLFLKTRHSSPTKEFLTTRLIRSIIRAGKSIIKNKVPSKSAIAVNPASKLQNKHWNELVLLHNCNSDDFKIPSKTLDEIESPDILKNGRNVKKRMSFKHETCKNFFSLEVNRKSLIILLDLLFSEPMPRDLINRFNFKCCLNEEHSIYCDLKWTEFKDFMYKRYLDEYK
jgi:hypothetical protein